MSADPGCELCAAARFTEWFYEDDECWIAECESCSVPMVVWRVHDPDPPADVKARLHAKLATVMARVFEDDHVVDAPLAQGVRDAEAAEAGPDHDHPRCTHGGDARKFRAEEGDAGAVRG